MAGGMPLLAYDPGLNARSATLSRRVTATGGSDNA
jgi:hypothetical protein